MGNNLTPIPVPGTDRQIMAVLIDGKPHVSLRHSCEAVGVDYSNQLKKLKAKSWAGVVMSTIPSAGGPQAAAMVDRRTFTMWLATIDANRVSPEARPVVEAFQAEAADALDAYFNEGGAINPRATGEQLEDLARLASLQMQVLKSADGFLDADWLRLKGRLVVARALGEAPEPDPDTIPLYVTGFMRSKGMKAADVKTAKIWFGRRVAETCRERGVHVPDKRAEEQEDGKVLETIAWTKRYLPQFEEVWRRFYADRYSA